MPTLTKKSYIVGMWFSEDEHHNNWMCTIYKDNKDDKVFKGESRFRWHRDDDPFSGKDEKNYTNFNITPNMSEQEIINTIDNMQKALSIEFKYMDKLMVNGDVEKFMKLAPTKEWMNIKQVKHDA